MAVVLRGHWLSMSPKPRSYTSIGFSNDGIHWALLLLVRPILRHARSSHTLVAFFSSPFCLTFALARGRYAPWKAEARGFNPTLSHSTASLREIAHLVVIPQRLRLHGLRELKGNDGMHQAGAGLHQPGRVIEEKRRGGGQHGVRVRQEQGPETLVHTLLRRWAGLETGMTQRGEAVACVVSRGRSRLKMIYI